MSWKTAHMMARRANKDSFICYFLNKKKPGLSNREWR